MGQNLQTTCIILESIGQKNNPQIWISRKENGWSLPRISSQKKGSDQIRESFGFNSKSIPASRLFILDESGNKTQYQIFVRTGVILENIETTGKIVSISEAWSLLRGSLNFADAAIIEESNSFLKRLGMNTGLDSVIPLSEGKSLLSEREMPTMSKILLYVVGSWLVGKTIKLKLRGNQKQISALTAALLSSKKFQDELKKPGATMTSIVQCLKDKNADAQRFENTFGIKWPV